MIWNIFIDKKTGAIIDIQCPIDSKIKKQLLDVTLVHSFGHGVKLNLGLILHKGEYKIIETQ